ncbi:MAG: LysR substrate-binding domain-containing protein [Chromatiales bacterium]
MDKFMSMKAFVAVAQGGSFARAAASLGLSRAMVTKHMRRLEDSLGVRLVNRTTRRVSLTEAGMAYRERCVGILADVDEADSAATQLSSKPTGTLRLTAPPAFGTLHLAPAIAEYIAVHPDVEVAMTLSQREIDLAEEGQDLGILVGELKDSSLIAHRLAHSRVVVCGAPAYLERHGVPQRPEDLRDHACLRYCTQSLHHDRWEFLGPDGPVSVQVRGPLISNIGEALRVAAVTGLGLVLQPTYMVGADLSCGRLRTVMPGFEPVGVDIHAVYLHRKHLSAKVRTFVAHLKERFNDRPYWDDWRTAQTSDAVPN